MPVALPAARASVGQLPAAGGPQRDAAAAGAAQLAADHQQPGVEHGGGVGALGVLEERRVDRAGAVVEGQEHHPAPGPDRRGLGGDLDPGDQQLGPGCAGASRSWLRVAPSASRNVGVGVDDVPAGVEAEDLQLGAHPLRSRSSRQPADLAVVRRVAEVEGELHRGHRARVGGGPGLGGGLRPHPLARPAGAARAGPAPSRAPGSVLVRAAASSTRASAGRAAGVPRPAPAGQPARPAGPLDRPGVPVELGDLEQQVAPGDLAAAADAGAAQRRPEPVDGVERRRPAPAARRSAGTPARGARSRSASGRAGPRRSARPRRR